MTSPLETIERDMLTYEKRYGMRGQVVVDSRALRELLNHYRRMENIERLVHSHARMADIRQILDMVVTTLYYEHGDSAEYALVDIMETLTPLIKKSKNAREIDAVFNRGG